MVLFVMLICGIRPPIALLLAILTKKLIRILILIPTLPDYKRGFFPANRDPAAKVLLLPIGMV